VNCHREEIENYLAGRDTKNLATSIGNLAANRSPIFARPIIASLSQPDARPSPFVDELDAGDFQGPTDREVVGCRLNRPYRAGRTFSAGRCRMRHHPERAAMNNRGRLSIFRQLRLVGPVCSLLLFPFSAAS
jgi:hypothetical protein